MHRLRTPPRLDPRPEDAHKASVGRVLVIGGHRDMAGAPALAALGALRAGAGLVRIAVPASVQGVVAAIRPEATTAGLPATRKGGLGLGAAKTAFDLVPGWDSAVVGPGAGREAPTQKELRKIAADLPRPVVLDADGLFALGTRPERVAKRTDPTVLTPHEGEAGRLLGVPSQEIRDDREAAALALAERSKAVVVLKGPGTIVTDGDRMYRCPKGGPWLATGGSGDVLSGVVGAFLAGLPATGGDPFGAAVAGVWIHASAADRLAKGLDRGLLASDIAHAIPNTLPLLLRRSSRRKG